MSEAKIQFSRPGHQKQAFLKAIREVDIVEKTKPDITELEQIKPGKFGDEKLYVYLKK